MVSDVVWGVMWCGVVSDVVWGVMWCGVVCDVVGGVMWSAWTSFSRQSRSVVIQVAGGVKVDVRSLVGADARMNSVPALDGKVLTATPVGQDRNRWWWDAAVSGPEAQRYRLPARDNTTSPALRGASWPHVLPFRSGANI